MSLFEVGGGGESAPGPTRALKSGLARLGHNLATVRSEICDWLLVVLSLGSVPALAASLFRATSIGWQPVMTSQVIAAVALWALTLFRRALPYRVRAGYIVFFTLAVGIGGLWQFGLFAASISVLAGAPVIATLLFGLRAGTVTGAVALASFIAIALLAVLGLRRPAIDVTAFVTNPSSWVNLLAGWVLLTGGLVAATAMVRRYVVLGLEEKLRLLLEATADGIVGTDAAGSVTFVNRAGARMLGGSFESLAGKELAVEGDRLRREDGTSFPVELSRRPIVENEQVVGGVLVFRDISARRRAERGLQQSEERFRTLADASPAAISLIRDGRLLYVNRTWEAITGYGSEEALSIDPGVLFDVGARDEILDRDEARLRGEELPSRYELEVVTKEGQVRWVDFLAKVVSCDGRPAILNVATDITARKAEATAREERIAALQQAMRELKPLEGNLPLCSLCHKIRDEQGRWQPVDLYIHHHTQADVSHGICLPCAKEHYPEIDLDDLGE